MPQGPTHARHREAGGGESQQPRGRRGLPLARTAVGLGVWRVHPSAEAHAAHRRARHVALPLWGVGVGVGGVRGVGPASEGGVGGRAWRESRSTRSSGFTWAPRPPQSATPPPHGSLWAPLPAGWAGAPRGEGEAGEGEAGLEELPDGVDAHVVPPPPRCVIICRTHAPQRAAAWEWASRAVEGGAGQCCLSRGARRWRPQGVGGNPEPHSSCHARGDISVAWRQVQYIGTTPELVPCRVRGVTRAEGHVRSPGGTLRLTTGNLTNCRLHRQA